MNRTENFHDVVFVLDVELIKLRGQYSENYDHKESLADVAVRHLFFFIVFVSHDQSLRGE